MATTRKQAVLLIHGIGEQRPMDTLRGFVDEVWVKDKSVQRGGPNAEAVWSKPYTLSRNFELRRLTTGVNKAGIRTDFFEFYWAHLMHGTTPGQVLAWARTLLWRLPGSVPKHLLTPYWVLWLVVLASIAGFVYFSLGTKAAGSLQVAPVVSLVISTLILPLALWVLNSIVGDAARYLHVAPANVQRRHEIRLAGVDVLNSLHERGYDRIIVAGHSLGTVIGYDILLHAWAERNIEALKKDPPDVVKRDALEAALAGGSAVPLPQLRGMQRACFDEAVGNGSSWRVTDFITMGSPLAHAQILLADDAVQLAKKFAQREFAECPPTLESTTVKNQPVRTFTYSTGGKSFMHHAAPFAVTRWTNLYFPASAIVLGDLVGGKVAPVFGWGVEDVAVKTRKWGGLLSHTHYWSPNDGDTHIDALRAAVNLLDS